MGGPFLGLLVGLFWGPILGAYGGDYRGRYSGAYWRSYLGAHLGAYWRAYWGCYWGSHKVCSWIDRQMYALNFRCSQDTFKISQSFKEPLAPLLRMSACFLCQRRFRNFSLPCCPPCIPSRSTGPQPQRGVPVNPHGHATDLSHGGQWGSS